LVNPWTFSKAASRDGFSERDHTGGEMKMESKEGWVAFPTPA
jgi:hypothetical protein